MMKHGSLFFLVGLFVLMACGPNPDGQEQRSHSGNSWAEGFQFYEDDNESGIIFRDVNNQSQEMSRWARLKKKGTPIEGVYYIDELPTLGAQGTTQMAMLEAMEALDALTCAAYIEYVKSEEVLRRYNQGMITDISGEGEIDFEKLVKADPDILLVYPYGYESEKKFEDAGIPSLPIMEYQEEHPLGKAEWIKVIGWLTDRESEAEDLFEDIQEKYLAIAKMKPMKQAPVVFTGSYSSGNWYAPGAKTSMAQFIRDAGGVYLFEDHQVRQNVSIPFENLYIQALEADFWGKIIYEEGELTKEQLRVNDERFTELPAFKKDQVFYCNAAETDYFGMGVLEPHLILEDLIAIFNLEDKTSHYFTPIAK